ncbi:GMC family oxidoreductase [Paenibacillus sp. BSR1-1]|uniref:GMC family oxidoreductase n=1 Tax=Paenibacillus sp. BSR1-1 TaxID=3020845 RepID=UPI0025B1787C|nr:GMC family oxidoreductase [Paenibacillus sp. BSR1-1]MDN3018911.1 GMC family oxidoreductase [Paenibacillus sp. BSR1-1]
MNKKHDKKIFDYIIIGAGTAGGIIAKKLTDNHHTSVLVLEAGTNMTQELSSPSILTAMLNSTDNRHSFNITTNFEQQIGRQMITSNGRAIGGSSEHNFMFAVRGSRELYDAWAQMVGNQWSYNSLLPLFKKNETYTGATQSPETRGFEGPIFIRQQITPNGGLINTLAQATSEVFNVPIVEDYNTGIMDCTFLKGQYTQKPVDGTFVRSSVATGYLNEHVVTQGNESQPDEFGVNGRKLLILSKTTVNKILFKRKNGVNTAVGVEFVRNGVSEVMYARKGVIVSAGMFSSVILQRSGIGKPADLTRAGIQTLVDNPNVGHNFLSQFAVGLGVRVKTNRLLPILSADPDEPTALGAFKRQDNPIGGRRLQIIGVPVPTFVPVQDVLINGWQFNPQNPTNVMSFGIADLNPRSKGSIVISHSDPEAYPTLDLNPLAFDDDVNYMVDKYIETYNMVVRARELDPTGIFEVVYPEENIFTMTDEATKRATLASYVRASLLNFDHFGGHCKMGRTIADGVVDGFLNVFGTKNLKVADLSIAPILPDGNTVLGAEVIGLNAARFIQSDRNSIVFDDDDFEDMVDSDESSDHHQHHHYEESSDESSN